LSDPTSRPLDAVATAIAVVLCLSWGFNQIAVKLALPDIPPMLQATIRSTGALPMLLLIARARGVKIFVSDGTLGAGLFAGILFGLLPAWRASRCDPLRAIRGLAAAGQGVTAVCAEADRGDGPGLALKSRQTAAGRRFPQFQLSAGE